MRSPQTLVLAGTLALGLVLTACDSGSGSSATVGNTGKFAEGQTFTMAISADPGNLDPHFTSLSVTQQVDAFMYDSLISLDPAGKMVPGLAEKWESTTTKATYTLRKGVTCADGTPLTATTVAANISFVGDPANKSSRIGVFVPPGAKATADDAAGTVTVTVPAPDAFLDRNVGGLHIVCDKGMKDRNLLKQAGDGTGMFTMTEAVPGDHYTMERRKDYAWGPGDWKTDQQGLPDKVVLKVVSNETTAANLLLSGQINLTAIAGPDKQRLAAQKLFQREASTPLGELWFNQKAGLPTADPALRKALTQALDLTQLGKVITGGTGNPATGLVAPGMGPCTEDTVTGNLPPHDLAAAKSALDAAGWKAGTGGVRAKDGAKLSLIFYYPTSLGPTLQSGAELVQKAWSDLGIEVSLKAVSTAEIGTVILAGQGTWHAVLIPLTVTLPSQLVPFLSGATPPNGNNFAGIKNPAYTAAVQKASAVVGTDGCPDWAAAEKAVVTAQDIVPFVDSTVPAFAKGATFELSSGSVAPGSLRMLG
ncbi:peptide/nickel transport system substrate-binding protein [Kribbella orskensis]|uniref:Peptide/nickel transport system substrate-binding protein n=1 Tax=Kribbella orskensis TaxID=2512216 RepID=A0ABY2BA40_9ACTN|nr:MULTISPECIES: ABC transporter substrate-binding protein [Kribbella]TCN32289.1 peptide/nickel transport system substrate-binding protein [Kribbella sp. VKM Ac-2500]TCO12616.1 peptide/nickel transport system substrate-binding protein [Kribbella orskensis]